MSRALVPARPSSLVPPLSGEPPTPLAEFRNACSRSPRSLATMMSRLAAAARILEPGGTADTIAWEYLTATAVERVMAALAEQRASVATINLTRAALRKMARVLFRLRLIDADERMRINDVERVRGSRLPRGRALTQRELRKLFVACAKDETIAGRRDAALLAVLFAGGLRRDETSRLDLADYYPLAGHLRVEGKGGNERQQPLGENAVKAINAWVAVRGDQPGPLFVTVDRFGRLGTRRLTGAAIRWKLQRLAGTRASIAATSPHDLRRSFITGLLEAGEDLATVSKAAGHRSITTTAIYDLRGQKAVAKAVAKLQIPFVG